MNACKPLFCYCIPSEVGIWINHDLSDNDSNKTLSLKISYPQTWHEGDKVLYMRRFERALYVHEASKSATRCPLTRTFIGFTCKVMSGHIIYRHFAEKCDIPAV